MRYIQIEDGLRLRFPARSDEFDSGVEIGVAAALMALSTGSFVHRFASENIPQIREVAEKLGFHIDVDTVQDDWADLSFKRGRRRPRLVLAHSGATHFAPPLDGAMNSTKPGPQTRPGLRAV